MTKTDLADAICNNTDMLRRDACAALETLLEIIKERLECGEDVKITSFGKWEVKRKDERTGRNPQTGEPFTISSHRTVTFKPSPLLKGRLNGGDTAEQ